jgi:hypothetical protein
MLGDRADAHSKSPENTFSVSPNYGILTAYALLSILFVAIYGITNPNEGDVLRIEPFILMCFTLGLSIWIIYLSRKQ